MVMVEVVRLRRSGAASATAPFAALIVHQSMSLSRQLLPYFKARYVITVAMRRLVQKKLRPYPELTAFGSLKRATHAASCRYIWRDPLDA